MIGALLLQVVLIFLNATFASAEIAVISMNETRLRKLTADGDKRAVKLSALTEQPARFLATIQVAITLAGLLGSAFAAENFAGPLVGWLTAAGVAIPESVLKSIAVFLITLILAYFNLVFGELVPKRIAMKKADSMALSMSGMLYGVSRAFAPLVFLLTVSTNLILKLMGINPEEEEEKVSEEEIRMLLMEGNAQGTIDARENEVIQNIFDFDDMDAEQICTHRIDVDALYLEDDMAEWEDMIRRTRHSFYPVCGESCDDIVGILDTRDYFRMEDRSREAVMAQAVDKAWFVPDGMKADVLFSNMKKNRTYFAVLVDEYGGVSGIITLHDLMEALVGELCEEEEALRPREIEKISDKEWKVQGCAPLDDVAEALGVHLPTDTYDTFNGFICSIIGRVPKNGERFECEFSGVRVFVHSVENHRIGTTTLHLIDENPLPC